jgi:hypothetical protein
MAEPIPATPRLALPAGYGAPPAAPAAPPPNLSLVTIHNFARCSLILLQRLLAADMMLVEGSSQGMVDSLVWLTENVFTNVLSRFLYPFRPILPAYNNAETSVNQLWNAIQAAILVAGYHPNIGVNGVPIAPPLELLYETVLAMRAPTTFS